MGLALVVLGLLPVVLTFGAIDALVPVLIIIILIAAAATLTRGWNALNMFGIGFLAGIAGQAGTVGTLRGKSTFTKGKSPGRGYSKVILGGATATQATMALAVRSGIKTNPAQAKNALVSSTVDFMLGKPPTTLHPHTGKAKMWVKMSAMKLMTGDKNLVDYHKVLNKLNDKTLSRTERLAYGNQKTQLEEKILGGRTGTAAARPPASVEEISASGSSAVTLSAEMRVQMLKGQGFILGPETLKRIGDDAKRDAEWPERQKAFLGAVTTLAGRPGFAAMSRVDQEDAVRIEAELHLYNAAMPASVATELGKIPIAITGAYAAAPAAPTTGRAMWANELGIPTGANAKAYAGYAIGSVATFGLMPAANVIFRSYSKWYLKK
jgi:hypothetical protein